jgi:hypothetical protein
MPITEEFSFNETQDFNLELKNRIKQVSKEFIDAATLERNVCVACGYPEYTYAFEKQGYHYVQCERCSSLYIKNPLADDQYETYRSKIRTLYQEKSIQLQLKETYHKKIFNLEVNLNRLFSKGESVSIGLSGLKYNGFKKEMKKIFPHFQFEEIDLSEKNKYHFVILDNLIEGLIRPLAYLNRIYSCLHPEGYVYITSRLGSGIDILMLWEKSRLVPTEHLNLFSTEGILFLIADRYQKIDLSTPGLLDVRLMLNSDQANLPPFLQYLKKHRGNEIIQDFQFFLQKNLLSSYLVLLAQKKNIISKKVENEDLK